MPPTKALHTFKTTSCIGTTTTTLEFAGIQCQIQHGDYQEDKHKPGLIENLNEYLPEQYSSSWGAEKKILKLYKKHAGLSQLEAKHLYTKTARALPTYGVTFFVVKEQQKGKKKLVPRLLGISSEAILRLDETTKEVLQAWPLTQVMTYHASQNNTFSLNFGDYSEKEYHVKTNDAHRIRDILEGYIDIIGRRQGAPYGTELPDSGTVLQETVQHGRSNVITHVTHTPLKVVEQSYVGPSRIIQEGQAGESSQGTQIVTVQQMVVTQRGTASQQVMTGEVPLRRDMSLQFTKKLNKMNANSVKIVTLLSDATPENIMEVQRILEEMEADMPNIAQGVREVAEKQKTGEDKNKLLGELEELQRLLDSLSVGARQQRANPDDVQDVAKKIADLTTQMYLNLDPRARNQSKILRRSRASFVEDEKVEANLRRASVIVAAGSTCGALDNTKDILTKEYEGPVLTEVERQALEASIQDKMAKINAAIAMLLTSNSDPNSADYSTAVVSMNTINELVPELAKDARTLSSTLDNESREALLADLLALSNAARQVCALVGSDDKEKIQEATDNYSEFSERLKFRIGRNPRAVDTEKSDEIIDLAKEAVAATTILLMKANELTSMMPDNDASERADAEGVRCGDAARRLLACAQLTAPSIHEPHCQSALSAAVENISSSSQTLALAWKPLMEDPSRTKIGEDLKESTMDVARALDRLRNAYANLPAAEPMDQRQEPSPQEVQRLRFITSAANTQGLVKRVEEELNKKQPLEGVKLSPLQRMEIESSITQNIAQVNAAVASLIQAMMDPSNPDYNTAELAMATISELMPTVVQDINVLSASNSDKKYRQALLDDMKVWCQAVNSVCAGATHDQPQDLNDSAEKFAKASQKLSFVFSPRAHRAREQLLLELSLLAQNRATALVDDTNKMADTMGGANASKLRERGRDVDSAAKALSTTVELTAPHIEDSRCRSALLTSTETLASSARALVSDSQEMQDDETGCRVLEAKVHQQRQGILNQGRELGTALQGLRETCVIVEGTTETPEEKSQRLKFIASLPAAQQKLDLADKIFNTPTKEKKLSEEEVKILKDKLEKDLMTLKSAVAFLIQAKSDPHRTDFENAEQAITTIADLMPSVISDTKSISNGNKKADVKATMDNLKSLNEAVRGICAAVEKDDDKELDGSARKFAEESEKLTFVFHPRKKQAHEEQLDTLCTSASAEARRMVEAARRGAQALVGVARYNVSEAADRLEKAADMLLTTAQLTSSSINDPQCNTAMTSSADHLLSTAKALTSQVKSAPHPKCKDIAEELERRSGLVEDTVNKIKQTANGKIVTPQEKCQRLKFIATLPFALQKLDLADQMFNTPTKEKNLSEEAAKILKDKLEIDLVTLKSAVASLLQAKSDPHRTDFDNAELAIHAIADLMPSVINDTKSISNGNKKGDVKATLEYLKALNDAARGICAAVQKDDDKELDASARKFAVESEKLTFVFAPRKKQPKEEQLDTLCTSASAEARRMAEAARRGAQALDGVARYNVSEAADRLEKAADTLVTTEQLTSSSINDPQCNTAMTSSADHLLSTAKALTSQVKSAPHPKCKDIAEELERRSGLVEDTVNKIKQTANGKTETPEEKCQRLKFIATLPFAQQKLDRADQMFNTPTKEKNLTEEEAKILKDKLEKDLVTLKSAVASLLQAKSDPHRTDFDNAELAIHTIADLMPSVINDTKSISNGNKKGDVKATLEYLKALNDAARGICAAVQKDDDKELDASARKFAVESEKLTFVFAPRKKQPKEDQLDTLCTSASAEARRMAEAARRGVQALDGVARYNVSEAADRLEKAADMLVTTAQLTSSSINDPQCNTAMTSSADHLLSTAKALTSQVKSAPHPKCKDIAEELERRSALVEDTVNKIKQTANGKTETPEEKCQRLKFIATLPFAQQKLDRADQMFNTPTKEKNLTEEEAKILKDNLEKDLVTLKSAVASLLQAKSDPHRTDFDNAELAIHTIADLMPSVINDTKSISNGNKKGDVKATLEYLKALNDAARGICAAVQKDDDKELDASARKFAVESEKLTFVFAPRKKQPKEEQLNTLCTSASADARRMVEAARRGAQKLDGVARYDVSEAADRLEKAADILVTTAQLTSSSINDPQCKTAMTSSADHLLSTAKALTAEVKSAPHAKCKEIAEELERRSSLVEDTVNKIKQTANAEDKSCRVPPPIPIKKSTLTSKPQTEDESKLYKGSESESHYHKPMSTIKAVKICDFNKIATQDFLHALRAEESSNKAVTLANSAVEDNNNDKLTKENEKLKQTLAKTVQDSEKPIKEGIDKLNQVKNTSMKVSLTEEQKQQYEKRLEENLATASVAAASLLSAKNRDCLDYNLATESVNDLASVIPKIAQDVFTLSLTRDDKNKNALLEEALSLCEGTRKLCSATENDNQKFNEAAVEMGDSMARLIYRLSPCADPDQEKQVIQAAKVIGDSAYKVAVAGADVARGADDAHAQAVCDAGSKTAHTAGVLVYTAKLVAPSIHHKKCQDQLVAASVDLSSNLANYTCTFKSLPEDKGVTDLMTEAENLEKLLQGFRINLDEGKMIKRKVVENEGEMVIENTALRKMAVNILQDAKARSESTVLPGEARQKFKAYCNKLADAIKCLDVANHKCHKTPEDLNKRVELENSIQKLQFILLQARPTVEDKQQNNVVDLTDFVQDVSVEAEKLTQIVNEINIPQYDKAIMAIKDECNAIKQNAQRLIDPTEITNGDSLDGILEMDQFGQDCEDRIARFKSAIEEIEEKKAKNILQDNAAPLSESLNMLRFATKSALAVAQSATLDETMNDLTELQKNIDVLIAPAPDNAVTCNNTSSPALTASRARLIRSTMEVSRGTAHELASTVAAYVTDARDVTPANSGDRLKHYANRLIDSIKLLLAATSTRVAMFEAIPDAETIKLTQKVLKLVQNYPIPENKAAEKLEIVNENDVARLLLPKYVQVKGKQEEIADRLQEVSTELSALIEMVHKDVLDPKRLARTVKNTIDTAVTLANTAKAFKTGDAAKDKKIDDDIDDMVWKTFGLFKAAEIVSKDPKNNAAQRSLLDACKLLNDSINKLARSVNPSKNLKTQCNEHIRTLHMQELLNENYAQSPVCAVPYAECVSELENQQNVILETMKLDTNKPMSRKSFAESLGFVSSAVCNSTKFAAHSAYLLSVSKSNKHAATEGVVDVVNLRRVTSSMKDTALMILRSQHIEEVKAEEIKLNKLVEDLKKFIEESSRKINDEEIKRDFIDGGKKVDAAANVLRKVIYDKETDMAKIHSTTASFLNAVGALGSVVDRPGLVPQISEASPEAKAMSDDIILHSKELLSATDALMTTVSHNEDDDDDGPMTWVTFNTSRSSLLEALDKLVKCLRENGQKAGVIAIATTEPTEEPEAEKRSYLQIQVDAANKWLCRRLTKPEVKTEGEQAIRNIMDIAEKMLEDIKGHELEEMRHLISETEELLKDCSKSYDAEKARALVDKVDDLRKAIERSIVSRVVDDFTEAEDPMADLETFVDVETDAKKRKFLLEQKIAELLAQLGKVTRTARVVGGVSGGPVSQELERCSQQTELLAPQLVKAAEERVRTPDSQQVVDNYRALLAQYGESLSKVRDLCDRAVDPMDFVQTAGEKMQRLREESHQNSDPQRCAYTSIVIRRLANRVIEVGMSSSNAREDAEIMEVLSEAKKRLAAPPPPARASRLPDWRTTTAEILRATGEVESVLGGEGIFKKQPEPDQPIYNAALSLHTVVREWSARDNEVVAVAKRMAVLMARLSDFMNHDKKSELIATSKSIVVESNEVARLARKLALECSDIRIRTNLLQACERIPTISGQLKMLTTVKGSSLGHQRSEEDKEAMDMLVGNAQNLMLSVQDVLKGAESASVKIASQRGMRIKWVRKNYY